MSNNNQQWQELEDFPGAQILPLAVPVPQGSIHKLKMAAGTVIPVHSHPSDEYVYVLDGIIETDGRQCEAGTFWSTPANTKNAPHQAITDVEIITIRLGAKLYLLMKHYSERLIGNVRTYLDNFCSLRRLTY